MGGGAVTTASALQCPHGGTVQITSANTRVKGAGAMALSSDTFTVIGCPFQLPTTPPVPSPCVTVRWVVSDQRPSVGGGGGKTLSQASAGVCLSAASVPQGQVVINATETRLASL